MKKTISILLALILFTAGFYIPAPVIAQDSSRNKILTKQEVEQKIRSQLAIDESIEMSHADLNTDERRDIVSWNMEFEGDTSSISVVALANNGEVISFNKWNRDVYDKPVNILPEEAKQKAKKFIEYLYPDRVDQVERLTGQNHPLFVSNYYDTNQYNYTFIRKVNGEYFPSHFLKVGVSGITGEVTSFETQWGEVSYTPTDKLISNEQAKEYFKKQDNLSLVYKKLYINNKENSSVPMLTPVYVYEQKKSGIINGLNGEMIDSEHIYSNNRERFYMGSEDTKSESAADGYGGYSETVPEEGVLSKEKVEKMIFSQLSNTLDISNISLASSRYSNNIYGNTGKFWSISWFNKDYTKSLDAVVNAENGEILTINYRTNTDEEPPIILEDKAQKEIIEKKEVLDKDLLPNISKLIKVIRPNIANKEYRLEVDMDPLQMKDENSIYIHSPRYINDIPYDDNRVSVIYDKNTKEIRQFSLKWYDIDAKKPSKIMEKDNVYDNLLKDVDVERFLVQLRDEGKFNSEQKILPQKELIPAYSLNPIDFSYIDAETGKYLTYQGEEYEENTKTLVFKDIHDSPFKNEIIFMNQMNKIKESSQFFYPNDELKRKDAIKWIILLSTMDNGRYYPISVEEKDLKNDFPFKDIKEDDPYYEFIKDAWIQGIIEEKEFFNPNQIATKKDVTKWLINSLNMKELAQYNKIFSLPYEDIETIDPDIVGYAALSNYYNIFGDQGKEKTFNQDLTFTREKFIAILYNLLIRIS